MYEDLHKEQYKNYLKEKYTLAQKIIDEALAGKRYESKKSLIYNVTRLPEEKQSVYSGKIANYFKDTTEKYLKKEIQERIKKQHKNIIITAIISTILTTIFINLI